LKHKIFILILLFTVSFLNAQTVLLEQNVKKDTIKKTVGPNLKHFVHFYGGISFATSPSEADSIKINYGLSNNVSIGVRYKRKFSKVYALGYNVCFSANANNIKQNKYKRFIDDSIHKQEKLLLTSISIELFNRFNFGKRGNTIGKFIDLGAYGNLVARSTLYVKDEVKINGQNKTTPIETSTRKLYFIEPFGYGVSMRFGINRYVITADYRLSNMFKKSSGFQDLPRLYVGLQIGFF
jgi:hypothetical protein